MNIRYKYGIIFLIFSILIVLYEIYFAPTLWYNYWNVDLTEIVDIGYTLNEYTWIIDDFRTNLDAVMLIHLLPMAIVISLILFFCKPKEKENTEI